MKDINTFFFIGRQTRDIDQNAFKYLNNGNCVLTLSLACNGSKKDANGNWQDEPNFFDVTVWGKQAELLKDYVSKGRPLAVTGHMQQQRWTDDAGNNHSKLALIADTVQLLNSGNHQNQQQGQYNQQTQYNAQPQQQQQYNAQPQQYNAQPQYNQQQPQQVQQVAQQFNGLVIGEDEPPF